MRRGYLTVSTYFHFVQAVGARARVNFRFNASDIKSNFSKQPSRKILFLSCFFLSFYFTFACCVCFCRRCRAQNYTTLHLATLPQNTKLSSSVLSTRFFLLRFTSFVPEYFVVCNDENFSVNGMGRWGMGNGCNDQAKYLTKRISSRRRKRTNPTEKKNVKSDTKLSANREKLIQNNNVAWAKNLLSLSISECVCLRGFEQPEKFAEQRWFKIAFT